MRDMGAEVIVEPPGGDSWRRTAERRRTPLPHPTTYAFELDNRASGRLRSTSASLAWPELVKRLTADADVFITNLIQPRREAFGLTDRADAALPASASTSHSAATASRARTPVALPTTSAPIGHAPAS